MRRATLKDVVDINRWNERDMGEEVDFSDFLANDMNVCLIEGEGGAFFAWRGPGIYEAHCFFEQRGKAVLDLSREILRVMRQRYGARLFWAWVPVKSRHVRLHCRLLGWKSNGIKNLPPPYGVCEIFVSENLKCLQ